MSRSPSPNPVKPYLWVIGVLWLAPAMFVVAAHLLLPDHNDSGQCEGIGFGCATTPADTVVLLGILAGRRPAGAASRWLSPPWAAYC